MTQLTQKLLLLVAVCCALFVTWREGYLAGYNHRDNDLKSISVGVENTEESLDHENDLELAWLMKK